MAKTKPIQLGEKVAISNTDVKNIEGLSNFNVTYFDLWATNKWRDEDSVINELNKMDSLKTLVINGKFSKLPALSKGNNVEKLSCYFCELTSVPNGNYSKIKKLIIYQEDNFTKEVIMNIDFKRLPVLHKVIFGYEGTIGNLFENSTLNEVLLRRINDKEILTKEIKSSNVNHLTIEDTPSLNKIGNQISKLPLKEVILNGSLNLNYVAPEIYKSNLNYLFFQNLGLKKLDKNMAKLMDAKQVELYMLQEVEEIDKEALPVLKKANATLPITPFQEVNVNSTEQEVIINANDFFSNLTSYDKSAK